MPRSKPIQELPDDVVFDVARLFIEDMKPAQIVEYVKATYPRIHHDLPFTREKVYPVVREAVRRDFVQLLAPLDATLREALNDLPNTGDDVRVVNVHGSLGSSAVPATAAQVVYKLIKQVASDRPDEKVHLGLGIGQTTKHLAEVLGMLLASDPNPPALTVHALTTDHAFWDPLENPMAYFGSLRGSLLDVDFVGLHAVPFVKERKVVLNEPVVKYPFGLKHEIDIVVSSIASSEDEHGYLWRYLNEFEKPSIALLKRRGWVGDMMLRPYGATGPMDFAKTMEPITLFKLDELVKLARTPKKHVVLLCGPCGRCDQSKAEALLPLLTQPSLHAWNHLVVDYDTAKEVLKTWRP